MKIRLYIVTYNHPAFLNRNLSSLFKSDINKFDHEIFIINNHSNFSLREEYRDRVRVLHNVLRPDWSTGHLTRNWNQALINGFEDLENPACDLVVHAQDDLDWTENWVSFLIDSHKKYGFICIGTGDALCSYTPEAVKRIGLWDERFPWGYHVADYHVRAAKYYGEKSSINDLGHGRVWNPLPGNKGSYATHPGGNSNVVLAPHHDSTRTDQHITSARYGDYWRNLFKLKWGTDVAVASGWNWTKSAQIPGMKSKQLVIYPYFERIFADGHPCYFPLSWVPPAV